MALYSQSQEITADYRGKKAVAAIYKGARLVWEAIRSCFGKGFWIQNYPWNNSDGWKNID
jgi:hypothetical protein